MPTEQKHLFDKEYCMKDYARRRMIEVKAYITGLRLHMHQYLAREEFDKAKFLEELIVTYEEEENDLEELT